MKKNQKIIKRLVSLVISIFIIVFSVTSLILPDQKISLVENRSLQQFPVINLQTILDGSFENDLATWFSDQFLMRNGFIKFKYGISKFLGQRKLEDVFLCRGRLIENIKNPNYEEMENNLQAINCFSQKHSDLNTFFLLAPNAVLVQGDKLPWLADCKDQNKTMDSIYKELDPNIKNIDIRKSMLEFQDEYLYYKTDHHWTSLGAFYAYREFAKQVNNLEVNLLDYDSYVVDRNFHGTLSNKTGSFGIRDNISILVQKNCDDYYVQNENDEIIGSIYNSSSLKSQDKYAVFLGGNKGIQRIEIDNDSDKHLLLIKDSYANTFVQFLLNDYRSITIIDPRYYLDDIEKVVQNDLITDVMYLYNANTFVEDTSIADVLGAQTYE